MSEYVGSARRTGVIIAMSSGLVASMAIPAHAVTAAPPESSGPQTASIPVLPATGGSGSSFFTAPEGGLLSLPTDLVTDDETVAAPAAAAVDFGGATFTVVPAPKPKPVVTTTDDAPTQAPATRRAIRTANTTTADDSSSDSSNDSSSSSSSSASGSSVLAIAMRYEGVPYLWGGTTPNGFDCSGFTQYVYKQLGKSLPRTTYSQYDAVKKIPRSQAQAGDLVFFPGLGHVGIYVGGNKMIDAPHRGAVIQVREIYSAGVTFGRV